MKESDCKLLDKLQPDFARSLEPNDITPFLLGYTDCEIISNVAVKPQRVVKFLQIARAKLSSIQELKDALIEANYHELAAKLTHEQADHPKESFDEAVDYLKDCYTRECEVMKWHWSKLMDYPYKFDMDDMYIDLEITREGKRSKEQASSYRELFGVRNGKRAYRKIVLEGDPGTGKTTYVHRLVQNWSRGSSEDGKWLNDEFDLAIVLRLGDIEPGQNLRDALPNMPQPYAEALMGFLLNARNHKRTLIVLDAFDEMPEGCEYFNHLIEKQVLGDIPVPNITLLISSRISHSHKQALTQKRDSLLRTVGFDTKVVQEMFAGKITNLDKLSTDNTQAELYRKPLLVGMVAAIGYIPEELFDVMETFSLTTVKRYLVRTKSSLEELPEMTKKLKNFLGKVAFLRLQQRIPIKMPEVKKVIINLLQNEMDDDKPELFQMCCDTGLLWPNKKGGQVRQSDLTKVENCSFPHRLFMEYFAANFVDKLDLVTNLNTAKIESIATDPFSYFLTGFSPNWKEQVLKEELGKRTLECPWIYNAAKNIPDEAEWNTGPVAQEIRGNNSPSQGLLIKAIAEKYNQFFSNVAQFSNFVFDENSTSVLKFISSQKLEFHYKGMQLLESGMQGFEQWIMNYQLKSILIHGSDWNLTKTVFSSMPRQTRLEELLVWHCHNSDLMKLLMEMLQLKKKTGCTTLKRFQIYDCKITESLFSVLPSSLQELEILSCDLSKESMQSLTEYLSTDGTSLNKVDLHDTKALGEKENKEIFHALPETVSSLNIRNCGILHDTVLSLAQYLQRTTALKELMASENPNIGQSSSFFSSLPPTLTELFISRCELSEDAVFNLIAYLQKATALIELDVQSSHKVGSMPAFAEALVSSSLEKVDLYDCNLSESFIETFMYAIEKREEPLSVIISKREIKEKSQLERLKALSFVVKLIC